MIHALKLGNFKAFADTQHIPIRPLTLIFGANSSGKSSILHGLLLAHHGMTTGELNTYRTTLGGDSVDLGGFRQYIYQRDTQRQVEWGIELDTADMTGRLAELLAPVRIVQLTLTIGVVSNETPPTMVNNNSDTEPAVITYEIAVDNKSLLRMSRRRGNTLGIDRLQRDHPVIRTIINAIIEMSTTTSTLSETDYADMNQAIDTLIADIAFPLETLLPAHLPRIENVLGQGTQMSFFINQSNREEKLGEAVRFFLPRMLDDLISGLSDTLHTLFHTMRYLGPLRSYPPRHLAFSQHYDLNWFAGGGYAWDVIRRDAQIREKVNQWLSDPHRLQSPYQLVMREMVSTDQSERVQELVMVDRRTNTTVSHRDIGIGISQVLPVLVTAYASTRNIIAIEQPEIHLHPALQAELGDVFIESSLGPQRNTFVLETHSEHLILRIMRRMRHTARGTLPAGLPPVTPNDVAILFVQPAGAGNAAVVQHLRLDEEGELIDHWPGGFFEESFYEQFA